MEASAALRAMLRDGESVGRRMIKKLHSGVPVSNAAEAVGVSASDLRRSALEHLEEYERRRHEVQLTFIGAAMDQGVSIAEIGRRLGVSRQLISRLAKEIRRNGA